MQLAIWLETKEQKGHPEQMELDGGLHECEVGEKRQWASIGMTGGSVEVRHAGTHPTCPSCTQAPAMTSRTHRTPLTDRPDMS